jgi:hypothetical protein
MAVAMGTLAFLARVLNLGQFSMWLDEILETLFVRGSFAASLRALASDGVHPPLEGILAWVLVHGGATETLRRLVNVGFGVGTVLLLCRWVGGRFGARAAWVAGVLAALSPVHVRYSQELRPYSIGLFFLVMALWRFDVLVENPTRRNAVWLWLACLGCLYSLYLSAGILLLLTVVTILRAQSREPTQRLTARRLTKGLPGFAAALLAAYSPWLVAVWTLASPRNIAGPASWSARFWGERWQFLTIAGREGEALHIGAVLWLLLCGIGAMLAVKMPRARLVVAGALVGTLGVEAGLAAVHHWSNGRYDLVAWPFLIAVAALGITAPALAPAPGISWRRLAVAILLTGLAVATEVQGLAQYYRAGRPHWDQVAAFVQSRRRDHVTVFVSNEWTRVCLDYYLDDRPVSLNGSLLRLQEATQDGMPHLVVLGGYPRFKALQTAMRKRKYPLLARFGSTGVRVFETTGSSSRLGRCRVPSEWPEASR